MSTRDRNTDSGRLGEPASSQRASSELWPQDFSPTTIAEENSNGGYRRTDMPVGGVPPMDARTYGSAEAE